MKDHRDLPQTACLACGYRCDSATNTTGKRRPRPGDISICLKCGHIMAFAKDLSMRALTDAEMVEIAGDPVIIAAGHARARAMQIPEWKAWSESHENDQGRARGSDPLGQAAREAGQKRG